MCILFILDANAKKNSKQFFKSAFSIALFIIAIIHLVSFFNSENHLSYFDEIKNKIPFLLITFTLLSVEKIETKKLHLVVAYFVVSCIISSIYSYYHYRIDLANNLELYSKGEVMKTVVHHIYYAVLCCVASIFCVEILFKTTSNIIKIITGIILFWLYVFIHVMSVRTGIFIIYFMLLLYIFLHFVRTRKYLYLAGFISLIIVIGFILFEKTPTIKNKIDYTKYSFEQLKNNTDSLNNYSDPRRILSDKLGIEIIQKNKLVGVGIGDVQDELNTIYKVRYPNFSTAVYARIHNQYLETTAALGIPLGIVFIICLMIPLFYFFSKKDHLFITIYSSILVVMCWEPFLKTQIGTSIFLVIICIGFNRNKEN
ncbi:MAG TPA: O-antigen ligase family protein [Chitinophagales bacterium]|nr:O-antigen ligase family protein [Chitinophagales bacterium]